MDTETSNPGRDAHGRLLPGHRFGGRPRGSRNRSAVAVALEGAGTSLDALRLETVRQLAEKVKAGDMRAIEVATRLAFPRGRALDPGVFRGARTPEEAQAAVLGAMGQGAISPEEAVDASKVVAAFGEAGDWDRLRQRHEEAMRDGGRVLPGSANREGEG